MRIIKPAWVSHDANPIFSLDIHPDGSRLATGGQGLDCGRVVIWNMEPIVDDEMDKDENCPKMLCQMDNHLACVNCVRWSNNGRYLASGGCDKIVMIWQTSGGKRNNNSETFINVFGGSGGSTVEQWRCLSTLRGHSGDVSDLAWSPHDAWLATCSVDNTVIVWNVNKFPIPDMIKTLRGHSGMVKGVAWDPVGKYLASQSDDRSLIVWRTIDWQKDTVITKPFQNSGGTTHVLRPSWSPDGVHLVSAHAMNNLWPTAQIIDRDGWKTERDFVGHRKAITVAKFGPNLLVKINKETNKAFHHCTCAIGSRDRTLTVWLTCLKRPLIAVNDLFDDSVLDISWHRNANKLAACSWDGTVALLEFNEEEMGRILPPEEQSLVHQKKYGKSLAMANDYGTAAAVVEDPGLLSIKEHMLLKERDLSDQHSQQDSLKTSPVVAKVGQGPINKQIETRTADGRRRITPMFIAPAPDTGDVPLPFTSKTQQPTFSSSTESKSKIIIEKRDEVAMRNTSSNTSLGGSPNKTGTTPMASSFADTLLSAVVTSATNGTLGVSPASVLNDTSTVNQTPIQNGTPAPSTATPVQILPTASSVTTPAVVSTPSVEMIRSIPTSDKSEKVVDKAKEVKQMKTHESSGNQLKRKDMDDGAPSTKPVKRRPGRPPLSEKQMSTNNASPKHPVSTPIVERDQREVRQQQVFSSTVTQGSLHLTALKPPEGRLLSFKIPATNGETQLSLEMENNIQTSAAAAVHKVKCLRGSHQLWEVLLVNRGISLGGSSYAIAVVTDDNSLSIFSLKGQRIFPSIPLPTAVSKLTVCQQYVMVITVKGYVSVWDVKKESNIVKHESLQPLMNSGPQDKSITNCTVTERGAPVVSLSSGKAFVFSTQMLCWMNVFNSDDVLQHCSNHQQLMPSAQNFFNGTTPILASLQAQGKRPSQQVFRLFRSEPQMQQSGTISYLDSQIAAALCLHSAKEYKFWLLTLVRYLAQEGAVERLRHLCVSFLGPPIQSFGLSADNWESYVLGIHKHDLLKEILPLIGTNIRLQRLYSEFSEQLAVAKRM